MSADAFKTYVDELPLEPNSKAAELLFSRLELEAGKQTIGLSPVYSPDGTPPFLTDAMKAWYKGVQKFRGPALQEVASEFAKRKTSDGRRGFLFEARRDAIESNMLTKIHDDHEVLKNQTERQ